MIDVVVTRGYGLKEGEPFVSPLITEVAVAQAKGVALLDEFSAMHSSLVLEIPYTSGLALGDTVRVDEGVNSLVWVGKLVGISHRIQDVSFLTELTLDKVDVR